MISRKHRQAIIARSQHRTYKKRTPTKKRPCKKCGRLFTKYHNRQEYCKGCQPIVRREQHNKAEHDYHQRWKSTINRRKMLKPGTNELPQKIGGTWEKEAQIIKKEKKHTYYPYKTMYSKHILGF